MIIAIHRFLPSTQEEGLRAHPLLSTVLLSFGTKILSLLCEFKPQLLPAGIQDRMMLRIMIKLEIGLSLEMASH